MQRSRSLSPANSAELGSKRRGRAEQRIQDLEELLQLKVTSAHRLTENTHYPSISSPLSNYKYPNPHYRLAGCPLFSAAHSVVLSFLSQASVSIFHASGC